MKINKDYFNQIEIPTFILRKACDDRVETIPVIAATYDQKYMDIDEIQITTPLLIDNEPNKVYELLDVMKYVEVPTVGVFCIADINVVSEGTENERKEITLKSREWELGQKYLEMFDVSVLTDSEGDYTISLQDLMSFVIDEKFPDWSVGYIDPAIATKQRTFEEINRQDIYSFITTDIAEAFEAVVTFNTFSQEINFYDLENYEKDTNIHLSYNNLMKGSNMSCSTDEIKTCLTLKGENDITVREVNFGLDAIYNFDYFANTEYMSEDLYEAYMRWKEIFEAPVDTTGMVGVEGIFDVSEIEGTSNREAYAIILNRYQKLYDYIAKWQSVLNKTGPKATQLGYGTFPDPTDPTDESKYITFEKPALNKYYDLGTESLPSTGEDDALYMRQEADRTKPSFGNYEMYRWYRNSWFDVNNWGLSIYTSTQYYQLSDEEREKFEAMCISKNVLTTQLNSVNNRISVALSEGKDLDKESLVYRNTYLPSLCAQKGIEHKQMGYVQELLDSFTSDQEKLQSNMDLIEETLKMQNNFTEEQLKELSKFIREDELSAANYVVTDSMDTDLKFEMLYALLEHGEHELERVSAPQLQFTAALQNLYAMPEFNSYVDDFDCGNYLWVTLRDDYSVKAKLLTIHFNFFDMTDFSATFGNVRRNGRNIFTDVQNALNEAHSAATSVSFNASYWSEGAKDATSIAKAMSEGLVSQEQYIGSPEKNEVLIDNNGVWITTQSGDHGIESTNDYDAIYLGGGRMLITSDGWRSVSMSVGRTDNVSVVTVDDNENVTITTDSKFGVMADFIMAGSIMGSDFVGGNIVSQNYKKGVVGTFINLDKSHIYLYGDKDKSNRSTLVYDGQKLTISGNAANVEITGTIKARAGVIGSDTNPIHIGHSNNNPYIYSNKSSLRASVQNGGFYIGADGIALGSVRTRSSETHSIFEATADGKLYLWGDKGSLKFDGSNLVVNGSGTFDGTIKARSGVIGTDKKPITIGGTDTAAYIYSGSHSSQASTNDGFYLGTDGMSIGSKFSVNSQGVIKATGGTIGGWYIGTDSLNNNIPYTGQKDSKATGMGTYGGNWAFWAGNGKFSVDQGGNLYTNAITAENGKIGGCTIESSRIWGGGTSENPSWYIASGGSAGFKDVSISGVKGGSTFGGLSLNNDLQTSLANAISITSSFFDGVQGMTFGDTFKAGIDLRVNSLTAKFITADEVSAAYVKTNVLTGQEGERLNIYSNNLVCNQFTMGRLTCKGPQQITDGDGHTWLIVGART